MVAIKYADTDCESFGLSEEIFKNNHQFLNSHLCRYSRINKTGTPGIQKKLTQPT